MPRLSILKRGQGSQYLCSDTESIHSLPPSPLPAKSHFLHANGNGAYHYHDDETTSPLLGAQRAHAWLDDPPRRRRRSKEDGYCPGPIKRALLRCYHSPFCPTTPLSLFLALVLATTFVTSVTFFLIWYLNPDKVVLPWRAYCSVPPDPPHIPSIYALATDTVSPPQLLRLSNSSTPFADPSTPLFPPQDLGFDWESTLAPTGIFLGILTVDSAFERRMIARTTWASHARSRAGAYPGDGGRGTSRLIVRFVIGRPRKEFAQRVRMEQETYQDIIILPITENMNSGKTHAYFTWAATHAWVPPHAPTNASDETQPQPYTFRYSDVSAPPPPLAPHDPRPPEGQQREAWTRPDFVLKADDDTFIMLAELEARLRIELHDARAQGLQYVPPMDPMSYWGYLVKNKFMAGEMYGMTWSLVQWVSSDTRLRSMLRGAEDKQTAKWMRMHEYATRIRWKSEHCWIYDHPRANKVYAHGFLFPSEVARVRHEVGEAMRRVVQALRSGPSSGSGDTLFSRGPSETDAEPESGTDDGDQEANTTLVERQTIQHLHVLTDDDATSTPAPESDPRSESDELRALLPSTSTSSSTAWYSDSWRGWFARTSVSTFGTTYVSPLEGLDGGPDGIKWTVEALVEGSPMSKIRRMHNMLPNQAYGARESRRERYQGRRVGGTIAVHFIKKIPWYLETALAFLSGDEDAEYAVAA